MVTERGRAANTIAAYRRDLAGYVTWLSAHGDDLGSVDAATLVEFVADRRAAGGAASSIARQLAAVRTLHRYLVTEGERPDDPTADLEGVRVAGRTAQAAQRGRGDVAARRRVGHDPVAAARSGAARAAVRHRGADLRGVRAVDGRHRLRRPAGAAVRQGRQGTHRAVRAGGRARRSTTGSRHVVGCVLVPAQWRRRDDAEAVFLNRRGGRLPRQAAWAVVKTVRRAGRDPLASCRRMCCATPAPRTCSTTAPTSESSRRCSATPRSRRPRCTPRSARSGSSRSTAPPTRGRRRERRPPRSALRHVAVVSAAGSRRRRVGRSVAERRPSASCGRRWPRPTVVTRSRSPGASPASGRTPRRPRWPGRCCTTSARSKPGSARSAGWWRPSSARARAASGCTTTTRRSGPASPTPPDRDPVTVALIEGQGRPACGGR